MVQHIRRGLAATPEDLSAVSPWDPCVGSSDSADPQKCAAAWGRQIRTRQCFRQYAKDIGFIKLD